MVSYTTGVKLVSGILIYVIRKRYAKCRTIVDDDKSQTTVDDVDAYSHTQREEIDLIPAEYDTIAAAPTRESENHTYIEVLPGETNLTPAEYDTIAATREFEGDTYTHVRPGETNLTPAVYDTIAPIYEAIREP